MDWSLKSIGGKLHECKPYWGSNKFDKDILVAVGSSIQCISSKTGELISTFTSHSANVSCINALESDLSSSLRVFSASYDGKLLIWNYSNGIVSSDSVEVINIGATVYEIIPINANELYLVQAKSTPSNNNANSAKLSNRDQVKEFKLVLYDIKAMKINRKVYDMTRCVDCIAQLQIPLTRGESKSTNKSTQTVILAASKNSIIAWSHLGLNILMRVPCDSVAGSVTCLSVSRQSDLLVTGHSHGEMLLWHNPVDIFHTGAAPICTRMHWHAHGVTSLAFSYDGLYVHSGGDEGVLVTWKTSNGTHSFLPRLGNAISCIVSGEDGLLVSTTDNSVCIVDPASMKTKWSLRQFYAPYSQQLSEKSHRHADPKYTFKLAVEPRTGLIATNGYPGGLQMTDVAVISKDATEIHQALFAHTHSITDYSRISSKEVSTRMYVPCVSLFKFYRTVARENVLCTVDTRRGEGTDVDASLKFWLWHAISHTYRLTAQVDRPHSASRITALDVGMDMNKPTGSAVLCVTSSVDGCVKVWSGDFTFGKQTNNKNDSDESVDPAGDISGPSVDKKMTTGMYWVCSYSFTYRDTVCSSVYLSKDSTILCLAHGSLVSIWDPATLSLRASVVASTPQHSVSSMHMIKQASPTDHLKGGESLFLVLTTKRNICVYDLLTLRHMWTLQRGRVTSICVATDEQESLKVTVGSVTKQAWIAVCVEETIKSPVPAANTTESSFKILLLGPDSATPILVFPVFDEISSITFLSPREHSQAGLLLLSSSGEMLNLSSADMSTQLLRQSQSLVDPVDGGHAGPSNATTVKPPGHGRTGQIVAKLLDKRIGALHLDSEMMIEKPNFVPPSNEVPLNAPSLFYDGPASTPSLDMLYANILPQKRQFDWSSTDIMSDSRPVDRVRELPSPLGAESAPSPSFPSSLDNTSSGTFEQDLTAVQDFFTASLATLAPTTNQNTSTDMIPSTTTAHKASRNGTKKK